MEKIERRAGEGARPNFTLVKCIWQFFPQLSNLLPISTNPSMPVIQMTNDIIQAYLCNLHKQFFTAPLCNMHKKYTDILCNFFAQNSCIFHFSMVYYIQDKGKGYTKCTKGGNNEKF